MRDPDEAGGGLRLIRALEPGGIAEGAGMEAELLDMNDDWGD